MTKLALYGTALKRLFLSGCEITDEGFTEIGKIPHLTSLSFVNITKVNDCHINNIIQNNHKLTNINVYFRCQITVSTLFSIAKNCPNVQHIFTLDNIATPEACWELVHRRPNLLYINSNTVRNFLKERKKQLKNIII